MFPQQGPSDWLPRACLVGTLADGHAFELEPCAPTLPALELLSLAPGDPDVSLGRPRFAPDDILRKLLPHPQPGNWGMKPKGRESQGQSLSRSLSF